MLGRKHSHYFKDVSRYEEIDVYRVLELFNVTDQCIGHAIKKLLVAGGRGAGKDIERDIKEAVDSLERWQEMRKEDKSFSVRAHSGEHPVDIVGVLNRVNNYDSRVLGQLHAYVGGLLEDSKAMTDIGSTNT